MSRFDDGFVSGLTFGPGSELQIFLMSWIAVTFPM